MAGTLTRRGALRPGPPSRPRPRGAGSRGRRRQARSGRRLRGRRRCPRPAAGRPAAAPSRSPGASATRTDAIRFAATRSNGPAPGRNGSLPGPNPPAEPVAPGVGERRLDRDRIRVHADQLARAEEAGRDRQNPGPAADVEQPGAPVRRGAAGQEAVVRPALDPGQAEARRGMEAGAECHPRIHGDHHVAGRAAMAPPGRPDHDPSADPHHSDVALPGVRPIRVVDDGRDERTDLAQAEGREVTQRSIRRGDRFPDGPRVARRQVRPHGRGLTGVDDRAQPLVRQEEPGLHAHAARRDPREDLADGLDGFRVAADRELQPRGVADQPLRRRVGSRRPGHPSASLRRSSTPGLGVPSPLSPETAANASSASRCSWVSLVGIVHVDQDVEVAARARPAKVRGTPAAQPDLRPRLGPRLDLQVLLAVRRRHPDARSQRRLGDRERELVEELRALALERRMRRDVDRHVQAARRSPARPDLALRREADLVAVVDAGRHADAEALRALAPAVAAAVLAGLLHDLALAATARAGDHVHHLAQHRLADVADLPPALALRARDRRGAGLRAAPGAGRTAVQERELDLLLGAPNRFLEADPEVVAEVGADGRPPAPRRAARGRSAEERVEEVGEATEPLLGAGERTRPVDPGRPEHVVRLAALRVGQDLVRLVDLLEALVGPRVAVDVRVPLLGQLAEGALDVRVGRGAGHAQDGVVVAFGRHASASLREVRLRASRGLGEPGGRPRSSTSTARPQRGG